MSAPNDAGTPVPAQRTAAAPVSAPNDAGTPASAERTVQVQGKASGPRVAQQETPGPRAARPEVRRRSRDHRKRCWCAGKTCKERANR